MMAPVVESLAEKYAGKIDFYKVDAPEGTDARPTIPDFKETSTSTVGLPRESNISLA